MFSFDRWVRRQREAKQERLGPVRARRAELAAMTPAQLRAEKNAAAMAAYRRDPTNWYKAAYKRRALLKAADYEHIRRRDVFERDGWRCRVCRVKVSDDVKRGHPRKAIMAHIVALAAGGNHTRDNVCCLCHRCNSRDGVNRIPIQTGLVLHG